MKNKFPFFIVFAYTLSLCGCGGSATHKNELSLYSDHSLMWYGTTLSMPMNTYHLNGKDIAYVDSEDIATFYQTISSDFQIALIHDGDEYVFTKDGLPIYSLNAEKQTLTLTENASRSMIFHERINNGVIFDIFYGGSELINESNKSKYLVAPSSRVIDLKKYNFNIVEKEEKLYAPIYIHSLIFEVLYTAGYGGAESLTYNGKDFFRANNRSFLDNLYCSSKGNFNYEFFSEYGTYSIPMSKKDSGTGEIYHFSGSKKDIFGIPKAVKFDLSLKENGVADLSITSDGQTIKSKFYEYTFSWEEDDYKRVIVSTNIYNNQVLYFTDYCGFNLDETYYLKNTRPADLAKFDYDYLRFYFNNFYGLRNAKACDIDKIIEAKKVKDGLLSEDVYVYEDALAKLLLSGVDDGHTSLEKTSLFTGASESRINTLSGSYWGPRVNTYIQKLNDYKAARKNSLGVYKNYDVYGDTAFITFDSFEYSYIYPLDYYADINPNKCTDTISLVASSMYQVSQNPNVKNVVFDVTCNLGGLVATLPYLAAIMSSDPTIYSSSYIDNSVKELHYSVDLNGDGVFGGEGDSFDGKYNFYILTSESSFSCGNALPTIAKNSDCAKVIGLKSAGGSQIVGRYMTATGFIFHSSCTEGWIFNDSQYTTNDGGVPVDYSIDSSIWYNRSALVSEIHKIIN